jgi:hypothetical protein
LFFTRLKFSRSVSKVTTRGISAAFVQYAEVESDIRTHIDEQGGPYFRQAAITVVISRHSMRLVAIPSPVRTLHPRAQKPKID